MLFMCIRIFLARIVDVSIGTTRTILMIRGKRKITAVLAFFEVLIWFFIAKEALDNVTDSIWIPISYAGGFAAGTYIGTVITNKFVNGFISIFVITNMNNDLIDKLRNKGFGVSVLDLKKGKTKDKKEMLFIQINRKSLNNLIKFVKKIDSKAFIVINETKHVYNGVIK